MDETCPMRDALAERTVDEAKEYLADASRSDLEQALEAEQQGKNRKTLRNFIEEQLEDAPRTTTASTAASSSSASSSTDATAGSGASLTLGLKQVMALSFAFGLLIGALGTGATLGFTGMTGQAVADSGSADTQQDTNNDQPSGNQDSDTVSVDQISTDGEPVLGQDDAPVTIVLFEDFECPFCKRFEEGAMQQIKSNYVDSGQVKVVWKDLPLPERVHPWADDGAEAMECVYRVGGDDVFWTVKNTVFANQDQISQSNAADKIKSYAADEGVSASNIQNCLDNDNPMEEVNQDQQEAGSVGAQGTPTVFVQQGDQYTKIVGAQPFSRFESAIETGLNQ